MTRKMAQTMFRGHLEPHVKEFDITGRAMKDWVLIVPDGLEGNDLSGWIQRALMFVGKLAAK